MQSKTDLTANRRKMLADGLRGLGIVATPSFEFRHFFSVELPSPQSASLQEVLSAVRDHRWGELRDVDRWNSLTDNLVAYVVLLDEDQGMLLLYLDPFDLYRDPEFLSYEMLAASDLTEIISTSNKAE